MSDYGKVMAVLMQNADKEFVKRILAPEKAPFINLGRGQRATHLMSYGEADGKYHVFPQILMDQAGLKDYGDAAFDEALKRGESITFDTPEQAEWFSKNYKLAWPEGMR